MLHIKEKGIAMKEDLLWKKLFTESTVPVSYHKVLYNEEDQPVDFVYTNVNKAFEAALDVDARKVVGRTVLALESEHPGCINKELHEAMMAVASGKATCETDVKACRTGLWLRAHLFPIDGGYIGCVYENETETLEYRTFFDISMDLLAVVSLDFELLKVNRAWHKVLGYELEELQGLAYASLVHPEDLNKELRAIDAIREGQNHASIGSHLVRLRHRDGSWRYMEWNGIRHGERFYAVFRDATESKEQRDQLEYIGYHDLLTGLFNRRFLEEEIRRLDTGRNLPISMVMGDVDRLKLMNDAFGHETGDLLIKTAAEAVRHSCRPEDLVARWGGDEFFILFPRTKPEDAAKIIERIKDNLRGLKINAVPVSISFGLAAKEDYSTSIDKVMVAAEDAMYQAKTVNRPNNRKNIVDTVLECLYEENPYEKGHSERVGNLCRKTAEALGLPEEAAEKIQLAGMLHDIGKVAIDNQVLYKEGRLTHEEMARLKQHPETGYKIVGADNGMAAVGEAIRSHHERWDGTGYPLGTRSEETPLFARILALAESYDVMVHDSPYHKAISHERAVEEIKKGMGRQFDPNIAEVFINEVVNL